jgi:large subunit ribosomal protein L15
MNLASLKPPCGSRKRRKRIGRGDASGHGGTSTKGHKGQKARAGGKVRPGFEGGQMPLSRRLPKRGFRNIFKKEFAIVNLGQLKLFSQGETVDEMALRARGLVKDKDLAVKLLAKGEIDYPLVVKLPHLSQTARVKILAAGGQVIEGV